MKRPVINIAPFILAAIVICLAIVPAAHGAIWYVDDNAPGDPAPHTPDVGDPAENGSHAHPFDAIQEAIDAASDGDTIIVLDGTYTGSGNRNVNFNGKAVGLCSQNGPDNCVIDCRGSEEDSHRGFFFHNGEDERSVVAGFTITGGYHPEGAAIACHDSSPTIMNNIIAGNTSETDGGGIYCSGAMPVVVNNTLTGNTAARRGGGIACDDSFAIVTGSIVRANAAEDGPQIALWSSRGGTSSVTVGYCDVAGGQRGAFMNEGCTLAWSTANLDVDPLFAAPGGRYDNGTPHDASDDVWLAGDYHLKSTRGRWDRVANGGAGGWVNDLAASPCADAGDPTADYSNEPQPNGYRANIGAYANTAQASRSIGWKMPGDADGNARVDENDMMFVRGRLNRNAAAEDNWKADLNKDGKINILDLIMVRNKIQRRRQ